MKNTLLIDKVESKNLENGMTVFDNAALATKGAGGDESEYNHPRSIDD